MNSLVGFTISSKLSEGGRKILRVAQARALSYFGHLEMQSLTIGESSLELWGHSGMSERLHTMPDGSLLALIGSPHNKVDWSEVQHKLLADDFELPWDGRVILLQVSPDGRRWTMWNDWLGSIPVFHAEVGKGRLASTLEPVTVAAAGYTPDDFFMPGLVSLLINGHYLSDWTLYQEMKVVPPDSVIEWDEKGFRSKQVWSVEPSQSRWETGWDDLVDEMYELSHKAIADVLKTQPTWILPLSSGLDSRLIAGVAADEGTNVHAYAWGASNTTDVVYSRQIARTLGFPWKRINLPKDFLVKYTKPWTNWFGSAMHFHGMYQMAFLDEIQTEPSAPIVSGFIGEVLSGDSVIDLSAVHSEPGSCQLFNDWYVHFTVDEIRSLIKKPVEEALEFNAANLRDQLAALPGAMFQKYFFLELWNRQRLFTSFQSTLSDYWRGVATPFVNRDYARFCMSLPRAALDYRRLLADVYRRYYGRLAVIPGTYAKDPFVLTGKYLVKRRIVEVLPHALHHGPLRGFGNVQLRMDIDSIQKTGRHSLWPLFETMEQLSKWLDVNQVERDFQTVMRSQEDIMPLRRLQSVQTLAYRLYQNKD